MSTSLEGKPARAPSAQYYRLTTTVTSQEVVIDGMRYPMDEVLGAEVQTIYAPVKSWKEELQIWIPGAIATTAGSIMFGFLIQQVYGSLLGVLIGHMLWLATRAALRKRGLEQRLILYTRSAAIELIRVRDRRHVHWLASEINKHVVRASLPEGG